MAWTETDRAVMGDIYRMLQKHSEPVRDQAYWDGLYESANEIQRKYPGNDLAWNMVVAVCNHYQDRFYKAI